MKSINRICMLALAACFAVGFSGGDGVTSAGNGSMLPPQEGTAHGPLLMARAMSPPAFEEVAAVLDRYNCRICHMGEEPRKGLRLDTHENLMKGSRNGPVVIPGAPEKSELILRVKGSREPRMPIGGPPWLTDEAVKVLEDWIAAGAMGK